jgi:hypothetical protein
VAQLGGMLLRRRGCSHPLTHPPCRESSCPSGQEIASAAPYSADPVTRSNAVELLRLPEFETFRGK